MTPSTYTLADLGFSSHFMRQLDLDEVDELLPRRVCEVQRDLLTGLGEDGMRTLRTRHHESTGEFGVGDWVLTDAEDRIVRRLEPRGAMVRRAAGTDAASQIIATNIDTLFIVSSCNEDFNPARLERYLALAADAGALPVLVLTKADLIEDPADLVAAASTLKSGLIVLPINATDPAELEDLRIWIGPGQTAALVGSSGVGKTTIVNTLTGAAYATQAIREDDAKGRHTTTYRSLMAVEGGGWIIDTPGMRALRLLADGDSIDAVFDDVVTLAGQCRFADCSHQSEPGCAVLSAIETGELDPDRLKRWQKLQRENRFNSESVAESRKRSKDFGKMVRRIVKEGNARRGG